MSTITRLQIEMEAERLAELDELQARGSLRTRKELINNALTLLKWAANEKAAGKAIFSVDESQTEVRELQMPFLEDVASAARSKSFKFPRPASASAGSSVGGSVRATKQKQTV